IGQFFLYWMRLLHSLWSWLSDGAPPPPETAAVYAFTGTDTRLNWMNPDQTARDAIATPSAGDRRNIRPWRWNQTRARPRKSGAAATRRAVIGPVNPPRIDQQQAQGKGNDLLATPSEIIGRKAG